MAAQPSQPGTHAGAAVRAVGAAGVDFAPYRHFYLAQQRDMEANVNLLRAAAATRWTVCRTRAIAARDRRRTAGDPRRSANAPAGRHPAPAGRRFEALRRSAADDATAWMLQAGGSPPSVRTAGAAGGAELELRLQPVTGLMETLEHGISLHAKDIGHAQ